MKRNVKINLISIQAGDGKPLRTELITEGILNYKENEYEIMYNETESTDMKGSKAKLSVTDNSKVVITRSGEFDSVLIIETGKKHHCHYGTPYGNFMVGITAKNICSEMTQNGGHLYFSYVIDINSSYIGDYEIEINLKADS